ncbi:hypothetical protein INR49_022900 [Caranx melampygus]|nr:hypothetical protein INR49_022900 [Caranx melampygus]
MLLVSLSLWKATGLAIHCSPVAGAVRVDIHPLGHLGVGLARHHPAGVVELVAAVVRRHDVHQQDVLGLLIQAVDPHFEREGTSSCTGKRRGEREGGGGTAVIQPQHNIQTDRWRSCLSGRGAVEPWRASRAAAQLREEKAFFNGSELVSSGSRRRRRTSRAR